MEQIKVGVIGIGHLGRLHALLYQEILDAILIGVYDTEQEKSRQLAKEIHIKAFESAQDMFDAVDAVNIVTPTTTHFELARQALQAGKHVFIEKPITATEEEARQLIELSREKNCLVQIGHIERFNSAYKALEDVPLQPVFIEAHRLASFNARGTDVAVILDLMIHDLDLVLHIVQSKPKEIHASGVGVISSTIDIANARILFENGCVANLTASRISAKQMRKMRLFQKDAYISMDFIEGVSEIFYIPQENQTPFHDGTLAVSLGKIEDGETHREIKYNRLQRKNLNPLKKELSSFVQSIQNNKPAMVSAEEGLAALHLADQIIDRIEMHRREMGL